MPTDRHAEGHRADVTYYKSRYLSPPLIYIQEDDGWQSLRPDGSRLGRGTGSIPEGILGQLEEISKAKARRLVPGGLPRPVPPKVEEPEEELDEDEASELADDELLDCGTEFRPRLRRYVLGRTVPQLVFAGFWWAVIYSWVWQTGREPLSGESSGAFGFWVIFGVAVAVIVTNFLREFFRSRQDFVIRVSQVAVTGPQKWWSGTRMRGLRRTIFLTQLDRPRSLKRSLVDRLLGRQYLYSVGGERIYLPRLFLSHADTCRLLELLGLRR